MYILRLYTFALLCLILSFSSQICLSEESERRPQIGVVDQNIQVELQNVFTEFTTECLAKHDCNCDALFVSSESATEFLNTKKSDKNAFEDKKKEEPLSISHLISNGMDVCRHYVNTPLPKNTQITAQVEYMSFVRVFVPNTIFGVAVIREVDNDVSDDTHVSGVAKEYAVLVSFYGTKMQFMHIYAPLIVEKDDDGESDGDHKILKSVMDKVKDIMKSLQPLHKNKHDDSEHVESIDKEFAGEILTPEHVQHHHKHENVKETIEKMYHNHHMDSETRKVVEDVKEGLKKQYHDLKMAGNKTWKDFKDAVKENGCVRQICANATSPKECIQEIAEKKGFNITIPSIFYDKNQNEGFMVTVFSIPEEIEDSETLENSNLEKRALMAVSAKPDEDNNEARFTFLDRNRIPKRVWQGFEPGIRNVNPEREAEDGKKGTRREWDWVSEDRDDSNDDNSESDRFEYRRYGSQHSRENKHKRNDMYDTSDEEYQMRDRYGLKGKHGKHYGHELDKWNFGEERRGNEKNRNHYFRDRYGAVEREDFEKSSPSRRFEQLNQDEGNVSFEKTRRGICDCGVECENADDKCGCCMGMKYKHEFMGGHNIEREINKEFEKQMKKMRREFDGGDIEHELKEHEKHEEDNHKHRYEKDEHENHKHHEHERHEQHEKYGHQHETYEHLKRAKEDEHKEHEHEQHHHIKHEDDKHEHDRHEHNKHEREKHEHEKHEKHEHEHEHEHRKHEHDKPEDEKHEHKKHKEHEKHEHEKHEHEKHEHGKHEHKKGKEEHKHKKCKKGEKCDKKHPRSEAMLTYFRLNDETGLIQKLIMIPTTDSLIETYPQTPRAAHGFAFFVILFSLFCSFIVALYKHSKKQNFENDATPYLLTEEPSDNYHHIMRAS